MIDWLKKNKDSLSIRGIEKELKMPDSTLIKAVSGVQKLPKKWEIPLYEHITQICELPDCKKALVCCGVELDEGLGKYGCPNCCGDNIAEYRVIKIVQ
jgi:hypothetical protein